MLIWGMIAVGAFVVALFSSLAAIWLVSRGWSAFPAGITTALIVTAVLLGGLKASDWIGNRR